MYLTPAAKRSEYPLGLKEDQLLIETVVQSLIVSTLCDPMECSARPALRFMPVESVMLVEESLSTLQEQLGSVSWEPLSGTRS